MVAIGEACTMSEREKRIQGSISSATVHGGERFGVLSGAGTQETSLETKSAGGVAGVGIRAAG